MIKSQVPYFEKYLTTEQSGYQVKIQVLSDISIFEWIIKYAEYVNHQQKPKQYQFSRSQSQKALPIKPEIEYQKLTSILNSAEYLGMKKLVTQFFKQLKCKYILLFYCVILNVQSSLLPSQYLNFSQDSMKALAQSFGIKDNSIKVLLSLPQNTFKESLFKTKVLQTLSMPSCDIYICNQCQQLCLKTAFDSQICSQAETYIDVNGQLRAFHEINKETSLVQFLIKEFTNNQNSNINNNLQEIDWMLVYLLLKAILKEFDCSKCDQKYTMLQEFNLILLQNVLSEKDGQSKNLNTLRKYNYCNHESQSLIKEDLNLLSLIKEFDLTAQNKKCVEQLKLLQTQLNLIYPINQAISTLNFLPIIDPQDPHCQQNQFEEDDMIFKISKRFKQTFQQQSERIYYLAKQEDRTHKLDRSYKNKLFEYLHNELPRLQVQQQSLNQQSQTKKHRILNAVIDSVKISETEVTQFMTSELKKMRQNE